MNTIHYNFSQTTTIRLIRPCLLLCFIAAMLAFTQHTAKALNTCYAVADDGDRLVTLDKTTGDTVDIGPTGALDIEGMTFKPDSDKLYTADNGSLGLLDLTLGTFTSIGAIGTGNGADGPILLNNQDGFAWHPTTGILYALQRREIPDGPNPGGIINKPDLLFQINVTTGAVISGAFNGADYLVIPATSSGEPDIDDIAFDPISAVLFGMANIDGAGATLLRINISTGALQEIGVVTKAGAPGNVIDDIEGLAFFNNGELYGATGSRGEAAEKNRLYRIDPQTAIATLIGAFPSNYSDYEALACLTATLADDDEDGIVNSGEDSNKDNILTNDDSDGDGIPNYLDNDDDNDGLQTPLEDSNGNGNPVDDDTDGDGTADFLDNDDDGDGVLTRNEDSNQDGNPRNDDADGDSIPNYLEHNSTDSDGDTLANVNDNDDDGDTIVTVNEDSNGDKNLHNDDSDQDNKPNYLDSDDDNDGIPSQTEGGTNDLDGDRTPNYLDSDSDGDGLGDAAEWSSSESDRLQNCSAVNPICFSNDAENDQTPNYLDLDSDNDGTPDAMERSGDENGDGIPDWLDKTSTRYLNYLPVIRN